MKFRTFKKNGKKYYGKHNFYAKLVNNDTEIPESIMNAGVPGYCFISCKNTEKIIIYKDL